MAGRSTQKLTKLRERLAKMHPAILEVPILTADLSDPKSLDKLVKQSDVLVSMAGPFYKVGYPLVRNKPGVHSVACGNQLPHTSAAAMV